MFSAGRARDLSRNLPVFRVIGDDLPGLMYMTQQVTIEPRQRSIAARVRSWFLGEDSVELGLRATGSTNLPDAAAALLHAWRRGSLDTGWFSPADWWDPACDAAVECLVADGADLIATFARLGQARAELGCTIEEAMDDLVALYVAAGHAAPPTAAVRALAGGWAEAGLREVGAASCFDSVTGLSTRAYLEARLAEFYRDGRPGHPAERLCLVLVDVDVPSALDGLPALHRTSEALRRTFTLGYTIARVGPGRFVAVAPVGPALPGHLKALEALLGDTEDDSIAVVWVESLPRTYGLVRGLLDDLAR